MIRTKIYIHFFIMLCLSKKALTREGKEDPCRCVTGRLQAAEVELADGHGDGVLHGQRHRHERVEAGRAHEEEEAAEGAENDDKLYQEGGEAHETELDGGGNLTERLLET